MTHALLLNDLAAVTLASRKSHSVFVTSTSSCALAVSHELRIRTEMLDVLNNNLT